MPILHLICLAVVAAGPLATLSTLAEARRDLRAARRAGLDGAKLLTAVRAHRHEQFRLVKHLTCVGGLALAWLVEGGACPIPLATIATVSALLTWTSLQDVHYRRRIDVARDPHRAGPVSPVQLAWSGLLAAGVAVVAVLLIANAAARWTAVEEKQDAGRERVLQELADVRARLERWEREDARRRASGEPRE